MAQWNKIKSRGRVNDRRSLGKTGAGIGITGVLILMGFSYLMGVNPLDVLQQVNPGELLRGSQSTENLAQYEGDDDYETFVATVLGSNNDFWDQQFNSINQDYNDPELVLFRGATQSACGGASAQSGPHYCPIDKIIYIDETFFSELTARFGAQGGDVAEAYIIGHEVGHHVQQELGELDNKDSVAIELQADCYSGMWAGSLKDQDIFLPGEINEAINAAGTVGDDNIQKRSGGTISPESFTHGSSQQRIDAFNLGYKNSVLSYCRN